MSDRFVVDPPQLDLLLKQLRLPTMRTLWRSFTERADREGWPAARLLAALASQEVTDRERRRFERHRAEAKLPPGKTLDNFDFTLVPAVSKRLTGRFWPVFGQFRQSRGRRIACKRRTAPSEGYAPRKSARIRRGRCGRVATPSPSGPRTRGGGGLRVAAYGPQTVQTGARGRPVDPPPGRR